MKSYISIFLATACICIVSSVAASWLIDPYRIHHPVLGEFGVQPNSRVYKFNYLSRSCGQYNAYFTGDSRAEILAADALGSLPGIRFYNFGAPLDNIESAANRLRVLMRMGCPVSAVVAGESVDLVTSRAEGSLLNAESPAVSGQNPLAFYARFYLSAQSLLYYVASGASNWPPHFRFHQDGHVEYLDSSKTAGGLAGLPCVPTRPDANGRDLFTRRLAAYRELARTAEERQFRLIVWIVPVGIWNSGLQNVPEVRDYLQQLRSIPNISVIEADRQTPLLSDFRNWTDCVHFHANVFEALVAPAVAQALQTGAPKSD
jgi:hypothetical protein